MSSLPFSLPPSSSRRPPRRRDSKWANSALVVAVQPGDWAHLEAAHGPLAGMALQQEYEREAAARGGAPFVAPAQRASDFLVGRAPSQPLPPSSYRRVQSSRRQAARKHVAAAALSVHSCRFWS